MIKNVFIDTHVVIWLFLGAITKLPQKVQTLIESNDLCISPIVILEIQYLKEIGRINVASNEIISDLQAKIGLLVLLESSCTSCKFVYQIKPLSAFLAVD